MHCSTFVRVLKPALYVPTLSRKTRRSGMERRNRLLDERFYRSVGLASRCYKLVECTSFSAFILHPPDVPCHNLHAMNDRNRFPSGPGTGESIVAPPALLERPAFRARTAHPVNAYHWFAHEFFYTAYVFTLYSKVTS